LAGEVQASLAVVSHRAVAGNCVRDIALPKLLLWLLSASVVLLADAMHLMMHHTIVLLLLLLLWRHAIILTPLQRSTHH
jgi:hypothetical protein